MSHLLDRCIWQALSGRQAQFSHGTDVARRFDPIYGRFAGTVDDSAESLAALHCSLPDRSPVVLFTPTELTLPPMLACARRAGVSFRREGLLQLRSPEGSRGWATCLEVASGLRTYS